jgi:tetratricopeptide (TPR) repeat protein
MEAMFGLGDILILLRAFSRAEILLREVADSSMAPEELVLQSLRELSFAYLVHGRFAAAESVFQEIDSRAQDPSVLALNRIYRAFALRGSGKTEEALALLQKIHTVFPQLEGPRAFAELQRSLLLSTTGRIEEAQKAFETAEKIEPRYPYFRKGRRSFYLCVPLLANRAYKEAADLLAADSRCDDGDYAFHAEQAVKAGILYDAAGEKGKAKATWSEAIRRFPLRRCCFFELLAKGFLTGPEQDLEDMPYSAWTRSEIFYLAGLRSEAQGQKDRAQKRFKRSLEEDPSLNWPAYLAKKVLAATG